MRLDRTAGIYVRISSDPTGRGLGVARQEKACRAKADTLSWIVSRVYADNDVSASTGKRRPQYEAMLKDLEAGKLTAVIVWDLDRLTRRPIEIEQFIDLADRKGIALASVGGDVDLGTDNGRLFARIKGAVARAEVERKSARQKAANDQKAEEGRPFMGRRAFGYQKGGTELSEREAAEFRRAADALLGGASLRAIVRSMTERGFTTTAGNPWKPTELRRLLVNPRHAGIRVHRGQVIGPGTWPPVIDEDTHRALVAVLADPARHKTGAPRRHLLSGIATCAVCSERIYGVVEERGPIYFCSSGRHLHRRSEQIDQQVQLIMIGLLSRPDAVAHLSHTDTRTEVDELQREADRLRVRLNGLAEAYASDDIDAPALAAGSKRLRRDLATVQDQLNSFVTVPEMGDLLNADDIADTWWSLDIDRKRTIIDSVMTIVIHPAGKGARVYDPTTVTATPKT